MATETLSGSAGLLVLVPNAGLAEIAATGGATGLEATAGLAGAWDGTPPEETAPLDAAPVTSPIVHPGETDGWDSARSGRAHPVPGCPMRGLRGNPTMTRGSRSVGLIRPSCLSGGDHGVRRQHPGD